VRFSMALCSIIVGAFLWEGVGPQAAGCDPVGQAQFLCGPVGPEDLIMVPRTDWVIASGIRAPGHVYLINSRDRSSTILFPTEPPRLRPDTKTYSACPGPISGAAKEQFRAHGLHLRTGGNGVHTLYVVAHGDRETIEVFELDGRVKTPTLTWIGCVVVPEKVGSNSIAGLPDGGFVVTNFQTRGDANVRDRLLAGQSTGEVWEWHSNAGWTVVPGTELSGPNGILASADGKWLYIAGWGTQTFVRISRGQTPVKKDVVATTFHIDNLRWAPDGSIFAAGQEGPAAAVLRDCCAGLSTDVARIDAQTLKVRPLIRYPTNSSFPFGTVAIQVGKEIWVGGTGVAGIARFPAR
jgi:hypothetical protein